MNSIALSQWRTSFAAVLFETDQLQLKSRIADASAAIGNRLLSLRDVDGVERVSLAAAQRSLTALELAPQTLSVRKPHADTAIPVTETRPSDLELDRPKYGIGSQVRFALPSGAVVKAEIVVIFTASSRKNILVSFDKQFLRISPEQILSYTTAKA
jgi:hypothetical protein